MPRKGENIYKRKDGRWEGRFIKARDEHNQIVYGYIYGKSYREVKERLLVVKAKHLETSLITSPKSETFYLYKLFSVIEESCFSTTWINKNRQAYEG